MDHDRAAMKVASLLLQYPDERLMQMIGGLWGEVEDVAFAGFRNGCRDLMEFFKDGQLVRIQETYTRTFDLSSDTSLYLTYHKWGEGKERGESLLRLKRAYRETGYEALSVELPDFLPLVLEFLSVAPERLFQTLWHEYGLQVEKIAVALERKGSPYGGILRALCRMLEGKGGPATPGERPS